MDEIAPGVFVATSSVYVTTTTVVAGPGGGCLIIDPAVTVAELAGLGEWLASRGLRAVAGWSTHPHWDHVLWSAALGPDVPRYATQRAVAATASSRVGMVSEMEAEAPGHDLALFGRLTPHPAAGNAIAWDGPLARVVAHEGHAPGHGAVFLPGPGVLVAGDMLSDVEIPLLDLASGAPDPFGEYRRGLALLASLGSPGVRYVVPGHGHVGDAGAFRVRVAADFRYLDVLEAGREPADPRLGSPDPAPGWLGAEHARQLALARSG